MQDEDLDPLLSASAPRSSGIEIWTTAASEQKVDLRVADDGPAPMATPLALPPECLCADNDRV
jgi:hypothetical protein